MSSENRKRKHTDEQKTNGYDTISVFDISKLSLIIEIRKTGMPGDGGRNTFDAICRKFDFSMYMVSTKSIRYSTLAWMEMAKELRAFVGWRVFVLVSKYP